MTSEQLTISLEGEQSNLVANSLLDSSLGLVVGHRELLDALQEEWLSPLTGGGHLLMVAAMPASGQPGLEVYKNRIDVSLQLSLSSLPAADMLAFCDNEWRQTQSTNVPSIAQAIWWPGALPTGAIIRASVETEEQRVRLASLARHLSNVELPQLEQKKEWRVPPVPQPADELTARLSGGLFPANYNAIRGAAAMGWWAVPRVNPWYDLLVESFGCTATRLRELATSVGAPWLATLPWTDGAASSEQSGSPQDALWRAMLDLLPALDELGAFGVLNELAARVEAATGIGSSVRNLVDYTREILRGNASLRMEEMAHDPVGFSLQLVLARAEPESFKTWMSTHRDIPPSVWWSGAILCGAVCGYRRLPKDFRGDQRLRDFLAERLRTPHLGEPSVTWFSANAGSRFSVDHRVIAEKPCTARQAWFEADLSTPALAEAALREAEQLAWPCIRNEVLLSPGTYGLLTEGDVHFGLQGITVTAGARLVLGNGAKVQTTLDSIGFRRCLVQFGGKVKTFPPKAETAVKPRPPMVAPNVDEIPGLIYLPGFLSEEEQRRVLDQIDGELWSTELSRRVQHYGWRYDYKARRIDREMFLGELPPWAKQLALRLQGEGLLPWLADQVIVNEYVNSQGIARHVDLEDAFDVAVATISLVESWVMRFQHKFSKQKKDQMLERGSVAVMTGPARYDWTHEIPQRKREGSRERQRRVSITFRKVRDLSVQVSDRSGSRT